jgi:RNA polymerase sigma-B factor
MMTAETTERFRELRRTGDVSLRNELVEEHAGFAEYLARRFAHRGEPLDDIRQVALLGLVKAVERFDPDRGINFTSFAAPTITGEIKRHFRDRTWAVRVPRSLQELSLEIERCRGELGHQLGRPPSVAEIAQQAGVTEEQVIEGMEAAGLYRLGSLDAVPTGDEGPSTGDRIADGADALLGADDRMLVRELLASLPARERRIVYLRFFEGLTQSEIAEQIGISQMHVSRLLARSLGQLADDLGVAAPADLSEEPAP